MTIIPPLASYNLYIRTPSHRFRLTVATIPPKLEGKGVRTSYISQTSCQRDAKMIILFYFENPITQLSQVLGSRRKCVLTGKRYASKRIGKCILPNKTKMKFANKSESHRTRKILFVHLLEDKNGQSNGNDSFRKQESSFDSRKHYILSVFQSIAQHTDVCSTG